MTGPTDQGTEPEPEPREVAKGGHTPKRPQRVTPAPHSMQNKTASSPVIGSGDQGTVPEPWRGYQPDPLTGVYISPKKSYSSPPPLSDFSP